jgi:hypothetical protein
LIDNVLIIRHITEEGYMRAVGPATIACIALLAAAYWRWSSDNDTSSSSLSIDPTSQCLATEGNDVDPLSCGLVMFEPVAPRVLDDGAPIEGTLREEPASRSPPSGLTAVEPGVTVMKPPPSTQLTVGRVVGDGRFMLVERMATYARKPQPQPKPSQMNDMTLVPLATSPSTETSLSSTRLSIDVLKDVVHSQYPLMIPDAYHHTVPPEIISIVSPPFTPPRPTKLNNDDEDHEYELKDRVGSGAFGELWKAVRYDVDAIHNNDSHEHGHSSWSNSQHHHFTYQSSSWYRATPTWYVLKRLFVEKGDRVRLSGLREIHFGLKLQNQPHISNHSAYLDLAFCVNTMLWNVGV